MKKYENRIRKENVPESLNKVATVLKNGKCFLLTTHEDPDIDGIGSMLALGKALLNTRKDVVFLTEEPVPAPANLLKGFL